MPRVRSLNSQLAHIKDELIIVLNDLNDFKINLADIVADGEKYREIKPLIDKLSPPSAPPTTKTVDGTPTADTASPPVKRTRKSKKKPNIVSSLTEDTVNTE